MRRSGTPVAAALAVALALVTAIAPAAAKSQRQPGDTRVFALVPYPGFPARAYVAPNHRVYEGTYDDPLGNPSPSRVLEYSSRGALLASWTLGGQVVTGSHGVQVATSDARGRLVLLDKNPARVLLLNTSTGRFRRYATFADLPTCSAGSSHACSPALTDYPATPNYAAWGPHGALYVTDFLQAVIWRIPPGGGRARVWLADRRLDGNQFGTTGLVLEPSHHTLLVGQQSSAGLGGGNPTTGRLYEISIRHGRPGKLTQLWESEPVDGPDGFWIGRSGDIYVALAGGNQIAVLTSEGRERTRWGAPVTGDNGSPIPFDTPSSVMFEGRRILVANQSFFQGHADPANQAILDVYAGERGMREFIPRRAGLRPKRG